VKNREPLKHAALNGEQVVSRAAFGRRSFLKTGITAGTLLASGATLAATEESRAIKEQVFSIEGERQPIPCVLWTRDGQQGMRPLLLMGHGGGGHKKSENIVRLAHRFAQRGYAVAAIDQPNHGDREGAEFLPGKLDEIRANLGMAEIARRTHAATPHSVSDWRRALDYLQRLPEIGSQGPVAYYGVSMGTRYGVPLLAVEKRIRVAVLGNFGFNDTLDPAAMKAAAEHIHVPLMYFHQWDDEYVKLQGVLDMYAAFGSREKTMHVNPGRHTELPAFEYDNIERFFARHIG
jgi:dienelactone hydrolase